MNVDELTGVELRKAVAEAVGWEWCSKPNCGEHAFDNDRFVVFLNDTDWIDAIAACEAAGILDRYKLIIGKAKVWTARFANGPLREEDVHGYAQASDGPTAICRALLKALEAKDAND